MIIVGAGMAGLLAAGILRTEADTIIESQKSLPHNHSAVLRFRTSTVGDALNIPFKRVSVMKAVEGRMNPVAAALSYSLKTNGTARLRSSVTANGEIVERWVAPSDLVKQMYDRVSCPVEFGYDLTSTFFKSRENYFKGTKINSMGMIISTIPMPVLMDILEWTGDKPQFGFVPGYNINVRLEDVDAYVSVYLPDRVREENRISLTGDRLTIETALPRLFDVDVEKRVENLRKNHFDLVLRVEDGLKALGLQGVAFDEKAIEVTPAKYAKILPIDESIRRNFIVWASQMHGVYSLGRFATWRPGLLLDDVVNDVRVIQKLVNGSSGYDQRLKGTVQ